MDKETLFYHFSFHVNFNDFLPFKQKKIKRAIVNSDSSEKFLTYEKSKLKHFLSNW